MNIICIGLNKTGTTSLKKACNILGWKTSHASNPFDFYRKAKSNDLFSSFYQPGFFCDLFLHYGISGFGMSKEQIEQWRYKILKNLPSNSYYILTIRNIDDWIQSRIKHIKTATSSKKYMQNKIRWDQILVDEWKIEWKNHMKAVKETVSNYTVMNISAGDGWDKLEEAVNKKPPNNVSFPYENKSKRKI